MRTVGIEEEFLLVDAESGRLSSQGYEVSAAAERASDGQFEQELKSEQVESGTPPVQSMSELDSAVRARRRQLGAAAAARGARLAASATSPKRSEVTATRHERYDRMHHEFGQVATMQLTCGMHVHVAIEDAAEGIQVIDAIGTWLAPLVALSANSPFWGGRDSGYASYRSVLWGQWPTAGPTERFGSIERYRQLSAQLIDSGAAMDEGMLYFAARLSHHYPTVEIRVADVCLHAEDAVVIAALVRALVTTAAHSPTPSQHVRSEVLRAAYWRAARSGTANSLVDLSGGTARLRPAWDVINGLVEHVEAALRRTGDEPLVRAGLGRIRERGTGADVQRAAFARRRRLDDVLDRIVELTGGS